MIPAHDTAGSRSAGHSGAWILGFTTTVGTTLKWTIPVAPVAVGIDNTLILAAVDGCTVGNKSVLALADGNIVLGDALGVRATRVWHTWVSRGLALVRGADQRVAATVVSVMVLAVVVCVTLVIAAFNTAATLVGDKAMVAVADSVTMSVHLTVGVCAASVLTRVNLLMAHVVVALIIVVLTVCINLEIEMRKNLYSRGCFNAQFN